MLGVGGVIARLTKVAPETVSVVVPDLPPVAAVIVVLPVASVVAKPAALIVATLVVDDVHVACVVRSCVVLSENVPVAVNCCVVPSAFVGFVGVTAIEDNVAAVMVRVVARLSAPTVAVIVVVPAASAVASPPLAMVAFVMSLDVQVACAVALPVLLSE
jgi:hypothetical protein